MAGGEYETVLPAAVRTPAHDRTVEARQQIGEFHPLTRVALTRAHAHLNHQSAGLLGQLLDLVGGHLSASGRWRDAVTASESEAVSIPSRRRL